MKRFQPLLNRFWALGLGLAVAGVVLARVWAPTFDGRKAALVGSAGQLLALAGLMIIALGVRRRVHVEPPRAASSGT